MTSVDRQVWRTNSSGTVQWSSKANDGGEFTVSDVTPHLGGVVLAGSVKNSGGTFPRYEYWTGGSSMVAKNLSINDKVYAATSTASGDLVLLGAASGGWLFQRIDRWHNQGCAAAGACAAHGDDACDDEDPCTADACDKTKGCVHSPISGCTK
ncbi:MAG: hypothetical protein H6835_20810 [Planctomycetes bacterium]|nr:hypothetical protein [Planctomycetota bacterium]